MHKALFKGYPTYVHKYYMYLFFIHWILIKYIPYNNLMIKKKHITFIDIRRILFLLAISLSF